MVMLTNLRASQPRDIAFRLVRAGAVLAVSFAMIDPLHFKARMEIVPSSCLVGVDSAASGDATANDRDGLGLMFHHCRHGRAAPLAHHHNAAALAAFVLASAPINASDPMIFWPDVAAKPPAIDLNDPAQTGRRGVRRQSASQLVQQDKRGLRMQPQIAACMGFRLSSVIPCSDPFNISRAEGSPPWCAERRATTLYSVGSAVDPDHEAVIRFSGEAPGRQEPILNFGIKAKPLGGFSHLGS